MDLENSRVRMIWGVLIALSVLFGLQMVRVLLPLFGYFLRDTKGVSALTLAPIALGVFALSFLAAPLRKVAGLRLALAIAAGGLAVVRSAEQISHSSMVDLFLAGAGVVLFGIFLSTALEVARPSKVTGTLHFIVAFITGTALDTAIHTASWTLDLSWQSGILPMILVVVIAIVILDLLWLILRRGGLLKSTELAGNARGWPQVLALTSLGTWLFLQLVVFQNVARLGAGSGWILPVAGMLIGAANVIGLVAAIHAPRGKGVTGLYYLVAVTFVFLIFFVNRAGFLGVISSLAAQVLGASLISLVFVSLGTQADGVGRLGTSVANGITQLLFVIFSFLYYVSYDMSLGFRPPATLVAAAVLLAVTAVLAGQRYLKDSAGKPATNYRPVIASVLFLALPLIVLQSWDKPVAISPAEDNLSFRVMDYNLHNGFNTAGQLNMEDLASVIEEADADVIVLQEVSRGWLLNGSLDMMQWLSQRLDLPYIYGPTEGHLWGNAILSRFPITSDESHPLPPDSLRLHRGYLQVRIDIGQEEVQIIGTHLHHVDADSDIRQEQVPVLVDGWAGAPKSIITGDLNARPDDPEIKMLEEAGLVSVTAVVGPTPSYTYYSANPDHQIDYIWISPDLIPANAFIPQSTASDHLPVVADITLP